MSWYKLAKEYLFERKRAYDIAFKNPSGEIVLQDLARFCRANESCFNADARLHALAEGRREVWLRIQRHLNMTPEQLAQLHIPNQRKVSND